jgi:hypothetical protein
MRKVRQNRGCAIGLTLRREIAAISGSRSSVLVAVNALELKRLRLRGGRGLLASRSSPIRLDALSANR